MATPEVLILNSQNNPSLATVMRTQLRERYGVFTVATEQESVEVPIPTIAVHESAIAVGGLGVATSDLAPALSRFARDNLALDLDKLTIRGDAKVLESYRKPGGSLAVTKDPRVWINGNKFVRQLRQIDPAYANMVDFVCEQRGLFIKPARYKNQRNHWNAPTNGGLPIVRKRDEVHEGTFMLHDLFHFCIQDPLPYSDTTDGEAMKTYLRHRIASEATTLVLTDMLAVHAAGLAQEGYDVNKRRIYPLFASIYQQLEGRKTDTEITQALIEANISFALTGDSGKFRELGADPQALKDYEEKYEVFFSADYDWNKDNFRRVQAEVAQNPRMQDYFDDVRHEYAIPIVDDLYPGPAQLKDIIPAFTKQVDQALQYKRAPEGSMLQPLLSARKYLAGQQVIFYRFNTLPVANAALEAYKTAAQRALASSDSDTLDARIGQAERIYTTFLAQCAAAGKVLPQEVELYRMHAPLYPPLFINYEQQGREYANLQEKMRADNNVG